MLLSEENKLMLNMWESEVLRKMCGSVIGEGLENENQPRTERII
jgi:hypothetical protein